MVNSYNDFTVLGFDFGLKHIGVAVGQSVTQTAQPLTSLKANQGCPDWQALGLLIDEWRPTALIVGVPYNMDGTIQPLTVQAKAFAKHLQECYDLPVYLIDERLTTVAAKEALFTKHGFKALSKKNIDGLAAKLIVEDWLKQHRD